ncbi:MAG: choice-of-anchor Q domain-containing protein [Bacteroidales bacterium]
MNKRRFMDIRQPDPVKVKSPSDSLHSWFGFAPTAKEPACDGVSCHTVMKSLLLIVVWAMTFLPVNAAILIVKPEGPGNYTSIQTAYIHANSGDTVLVYPGTYYENLDITNSQVNITIASKYLITQDEWFIHNTIINGNQTSSCIAIRNTQNAIVKITGFTIENGSGYTNGGGGGLYIVHANPHISQCIIQYNKCDGGGGFYCQSATVHISGVTIRYNHALLAGGGINCGYGSNVVFDPLFRCNIYLNYSGYGADFFKTNYSPYHHIIVDTFTVFNPDGHFAFSANELALPVNDLIFDILNQKVAPVDSDLFVNPVDGNDQYDGLTPGTALKTISYGQKLIASNNLQPNRIYLSNGVYSSYTKGEKFPLNSRSYVSIVGESMESTVFDLNSETYAFRGYGLMKDFSLENITVMNGNGNQYALSKPAGIYIGWGENVHLNNLTLKNGISSGEPGIRAGNVSRISLKNTHLLFNMGGSSLIIGSSNNQPRDFSIVNCLVDHAEPDGNPNMGYGGGIAIFGYMNGSFGNLKGKIINLQLTNNRYYNDTTWGYQGFWSGMGIGDYVDLVLVNATINGNSVENDTLPVAVGIGRGSNVDIYNSIFYGDSIYELAVGSANPTSMLTTVNVGYSNIEGGEANVYTWYNYILNWMEGNIDEDPLWDMDSALPYSLQWNSPCIDAGIPMYEPGMDYPYIKIENEKIVLYTSAGDTVHLPPTDLAGNPRIGNGRIDMGAYEFQDTITRTREIPVQKQKEMKIETYPNPFHSHTSIVFSIEEKARVEVIISNLQGIPLKSLMNATASPGRYKLTWTGDDNSGGLLKPGNYIVSLRLNGQNVHSAKVVKAGGSQ